LRGRAASLSRDCGASWYFGELRLEPRDLGVLLGQLVTLAGAERRTDQTEVGEALEHYAGIGGRDVGDDDVIDRFALVPELKRSLGQLLRELALAGAVLAIGAVAQQLRQPLAVTGGLGAALPARGPPVGRGRGGKRAVERPRSPSLALQIQLGTRSPLRRRCGRSVPALLRIAATSVASPLPPPPRSRSRWVLTC
jgi:hypothetical protein